MGERHRPLSAAFSAALLVVIASCGSDQTTESTTAPAATTEAPVTSTPSPTSTTVAPTTVAPTTAAPTTLADPLAVCDDQLPGMLAAVDESIVAAQLDTAEVWTDETVEATFDDRTQSADEFAYRLGLDCSTRLVQTTSDGADRMVVAAWTGDRRAWVVQATDGPPATYRADQRVQLFIDQPLGEWLVDQEVWAGSIAAGDTVIVGVDDTVFGAAAKAWWSEVPRFDDLEVTNAAERYAIDALVEAGNRNVSVAEPASVGVEIATIQLITSRGLPLIATVAPPDWFDPAAPIVEGDMVVESIGGVDVYVTTAVPESYAIGSVGWVCGKYIWFVDSAYGTMGELTEWTADLIESVGC